MDDQRGSNMRLVEEIADLRSQLKKTQEQLALLAGQCSDYHRVQSELSQSRQMLQLVLDTIPVRVFWKDGQSRFQGCNRLFAQDAGLASPAEIIGRTDDDLSWHEHAGLYRADDRQVMETGLAKLNYEEPQRTPDGHLIWLRTSKVPMRLDVPGAGDVVGVLGTYEDITERKAAEEKVQELARLPAENPSPIFRIDRQGVLLYANSASQPLHEQWQWAVGRSTVVGGSSASDGPALGFWQQVVTGALGSARRETIEIHMHNRIFSFLVVPVVDHDYVNFYGTDVTDRSRVEEALQQRILALIQPLDDVASIRFEDLFDLAEIQKIQDAFAEATGVASVITDLEGRPITRPSNFCRLCRIIRSTSSGLANCIHSDAVLGRMNPDGPLIQPCLSGGLWDGGTSICIGDRHIANWLVGQVLDETQDEAAMVEYGRRIGIVSTSADLEEYRRALSEVTRMPRAQFERVCHALFLIARQLSLLALQNVQQARIITERKRAEAALIDADRRKDEFLAMLSHELRNPLAPIRNAVQILRLTGSGDSVMQRQREIIDRQVTHMARLLDDLLDVSRITRGKIRLKKERLDLRDVVDRAIETSRPYQDSRKQILVYSRPVAPLWLDGDPTRLEQVVCNLLNNAIKYSENGGRIWIDLAPENAPDAPGREVVLVVRDEGMGITPEILPRVFEIFTQASQSLDRSQGGLGIGLTLVQKLVHLHGGTVHAASEGQGWGSAFTVRLPMSGLERWIEPGEAAVRAAAPRQPALRPAGPRVKILVVDDVVDTAASMAEVLGLWGYTVETAYSGAQALERAASFKPDVVLLDVGLPGMDGFEVARRLRRQGGLERAQLIALTGYGSDEDRQRAIHSGFNQHFTKPVDLTRLHQVLENAFHRQRG